MCHVLKVSENNIGADGVLAIAVALKTNNSLKSLNLSGLIDQISHRMAIIKRMGMTDNEFGDDGAYAIADALTTNKTVTALDLHG